MKTCFVSIDIEHDLDTGERKTFRGIEEVNKILETFESFRVPATLFVTGDVLAGFPRQVKQWAQKYEVASHSYSHRYFNELSDAEKEEEITKFLEIYRNVLGVSPKGFRAPSHVIDGFTFGLLEKYGFAYDSSIVPHYPRFKKYRGYKGSAPLIPYRIGDLAEIPVAGQLMGVPLAGAWIRKLPAWIYRTLFMVHKPQFLTLSMHSWDILDPRFVPKLIEILTILKNSGYVFKSGKQIAMESASRKDVV